MRIEEPRSTVQSHRRLAGAGAALHDERALGLGRDQPVLVGLDRRDDVAHAPFAAPVELLEQEVGDRRTFDHRAVERLVRDVDDPPLVGAIPATLGHALRIRGRRRVERACRRRLPVDDDRLSIVVVHPAPPDVERARRSVERQPAEAEPVLGVLKRPRAPLGPGLHRDGRELGRHRALRPGNRRPHAVETRIRVVDIGLFGCELGVRHGPRRLTT
jgi:hypothetical protein